MLIYNMEKLRSTLLILFFCIQNLYAQDSNETIQNYLSSHKNELNLSNEDISSWEISDSHVDKRNGAEFIYIHQKINGIPVQNGIANFAIKNGQVLHMGNRLVTDLNKNIPNSSPSLSSKEAISVAANELNLSSPGAINLIEELSENKFIYSKGDISLENIPVELRYFQSENGMHLIWNLSIYETSAKNWWSVSIDAKTGKLLDKINWVSKCELGHFHSEGNNDFSDLSNDNTSNSNNSVSGPEYRVFALPVESPIHGNRTLVSSPSDSISSPFGWHDTNGSAGAEFTITRGNNVFAYTDPNNTGSGFSPDGTSALHFDFPFTPGTAPSSYQSAAVTNLFYLNNMMHDIWYQYGFDEASGNFQFNNYGNGGAGSDEVNAEAQDGGGTNNANFATPPDGQNPRMQMYIWTGSNPPVDLTVNTPISIAGNYPAIEAQFGPGLTTTLTSDLVLVDDATMPNPNDACETIVNASSIAGKIAVIDRGDCTFVNKVQFAQNVGAIAVIMVNNVGGGAITMGGSSSSITIPSVMISLADGNTIKNAMASGTVNISLNAPSVINDKDGDFDNGIIAHEYGHGISNRLAGGRFASGCLQNAEQMGEGWSDWFGLMLTIDSGDQSTDPRGIGTFASNQSPTGNGIRPAPYSTDFNVNNFTYGSTNNSSISQPHGLGFVYATALWDLTWALINQYGGNPDPDVYFGTGGNNIAMNLVITSLKLQPCNPGMLDGRDAMLAADQLLYNGLHRCLIWDVFANRGFGFSASQGSANSRFDQTEAFDIPPFCQVATNAPSADFTFNANNAICENGIVFTDASSNTPQDWVWDFGDGTVDSTFNPSHTYSAPGTYSVKMIVSNTIGTDSITKSILISSPNPLVVSNEEACIGTNAVMFANNNLGTVEWFDDSNNLVSSNNLFIAFNVTNDEVYFVRDRLSPLCASEFDTVNVIVVESDFNISQNGLEVSFTDASRGAISWLWDFGDGNTSTLQNPVHTYATNGNYNVTLSLNNITCDKTQSISVINSLTDDFSESFNIYPNPAKGQFTIKLNEPTKHRIFLTIENMQGSVLKTASIPAGEQYTNINVEQFSSSVYLLRVNDAESQSVHKLIIEN